MARHIGIASGESIGRKSCGWDETDVGALRDDAPVGVRWRYAPHLDLICRTAGYVTRTSGGVGGRSREASSYPDSVSIFSVLMCVGRDATGSDAGGPYDASQWLGT